MSKNAKSSVSIVLVTLMLMSVFAVMPLTEAANSDAYASFSVRNNTKVRSNNDTITSGLQFVQYEYALSVYNTNDTSDTVLGNLEYTLHADNIVDADKEEYAVWNNSYVKWTFPSDYVLVEDDWLWTGAESSFFEIKYVPMSLGRKVNNSIFNADGYQLAEFSVTYDDLNFDYSGGLVIAKEYSLVNASFLPDTFYTDAPLWSWHPFSRKNENYIEFNLDESQLQANKTYNFSVVVRVDLKGDNPSPILYKPKFEIWIGHDSIEALGPTGRNVTIPSEMLPEHVHFVSASTNVTNTWTLLRLNLLVATLDKISEPMGPKSDIHVHKKEYLSTYDTHIDHNKIYDFTPKWTANVWDVENLDNVTYTITTSENFTYMYNWELYQNGTENTFILPPTIEGQNYTWLLPLKDDLIGSEIKFVLDSPETIQDNPWADIDLNTTNEGDYTRVNVTFKPVIPLNHVIFRVRGDQIMDVSAYPSEFEIDLLTSSYVKLVSDDMGIGHEYNFSVLVDNPNNVKFWLGASFGWVVESPFNIITLPVAELGSVTVKADVPVIWGHKPTLPQSVQSIRIKFEEKKGFDTGEGTYPSIMGTHTGKIRPNETIEVHKMYTYPCTGTGGHTEYVRFYGNGLDVNKTWNGYIGDYHHIFFDTSFTLQANTTYDYEIRTGSYPQIIHEQSLPTLNGTINCTQFTDANGKTYNDWIPAIRLE